MWTKKIVSIIAVTLWGTSTWAAMSPSLSVDARSLPMLLIGYAYSLAYDTVGQPEKAGVNATSNPYFSLLEHNLDELRADIPMKLAFVHQSYVIQPNLVGAKIVSERGQATLYVADPIRDKSVVIISSVSPETTTIFLVDSQLRVKLIYDSLVQRQLGKGPSCEPLGQINGVKILRPGALMLTESNARWSSKHERLFELQLTQKTATLYCLTNKQE